MMESSGTSMAMLPPGEGVARIGEMLLEQGLVTEDGLAAALGLQRQTGRRLGEALVSMGLVSSYDLARVLAVRLGLEFVDLAEVPVDALVAQRIPEGVARRYGAVPISEHDGVIRVAFADPSDVFAIDDIRAFTKAPIAPMIADPQQLASTIDRIWASSDIASSLGDAATDDADPTDELSSAVHGADEAPIVRLVNAIIAQAVDERASDVHFEPAAHKVRIRFRVDGVLHDASEAPVSVLRQMISRLKILAGIDIARTRVPQDGRFTVTVKDAQVDVRMATLPTAYGEAAILRLLNTTGSIIEWSALGLDPEDAERYESAFRSPQGTIITSGPTGSGKTSTLYATLREISTPAVSIIAVEDPIEYRMEGIKQLQVAPKAGLTFPMALRSMLRSDPDVILVGEIRDLETARIAAEAAMTGHLVLSTIHTTRAAAVPLRLIDMGVEPFLVTSALTCIVGQRLVRRLCPRCSEPHEPDEVLSKSLALPDELLESGVIRRAVGCGHCGGTGYRGRTALYEVMLMSEDVGRLVIARAASRDIERWAVAEGMNTLRTAALRRVRDGVLSLEEMLRVVV
jgi:type IV pilus assembly protein PilB